MNIVVVDTNEDSRRALVQLLGATSTVTVVGEAHSLPEVVQVMRRCRVDALLADVAQYDDTWAATLLEQPATPALVLVGTREHQAVRAMELGAIDFFVQPAGQARLERALAKVARCSQAYWQGLERPLGRGLPASSPRQRLTVTAAGVTYFFDVDEIVRLYAYDKYVAFTHQGKEYLIDDSLTALEERLRPYGFMRVHRRELVNVAYVRSIRTDDAGSLLELRDGQRVRVSRRLLGELKRALGLQRELAS